MFCQDDIGVCLKCGHDNEVIFGEPYKCLNCDEEVEEIEEDKE